MENLQSSDTFGAQAAAKAAPACPRIVILGGGTAGWMTAAGLSHFLGATHSISLVESEAIGIVGVGEATLPHLRAFLSTIGVDEATMMRATSATVKLGIDFRDFGAIGESYIHPFGTFGTHLANVGFHHYWLAARSAGDAHPLDAYSLPIVAAGMRRFAPPTLEGDLLASSYNYAYQFDAGRMAPLLRELAEGRGVRRIEGEVTDTIIDGESGAMRTLLLADGQEISGDLFVDCSGFRGRLISEMRDDNWEDWSHWLPCDRAVAMPTASPEGEIEPVTRATAMASGWRWRIPLQHRVGNGYVYASAMCSDEEAERQLRSAVDGAPLADPRILKFSAGRRRNSWVGNVVAIGLASGFLEPLESTSIHLVQMAITRLVEHFPGTEIDPADRSAFNALVDMEYDRIRDFLVLHYHATRRSDSAFWDHVRTMALPDSLRGKLALWDEAARIETYAEGLFLEASWIAVCVGQGLIPQGWDPRAARIISPRGLEQLTGLRGEIAARASAMPTHGEALMRMNARSTLAEAAA